MSTKEQKAKEYAGNILGLDYIGEVEVEKAFEAGWDEAMEERKKDDIKDGIWIAVQFLVISHKEETLAKFLIKEAGLSKTDCYISQTLSDFQNEKMYEFINSIFKDK